MPQPRQRPQSAHVRSSRGAPDSSIRSINQVTHQEWYRQRVPHPQRTNRLLVKTVTGIVKPTTYSLPQPSHAYGYKEPEDDEGAREVIGHWVSNHGFSESKPGRNFVLLNKGALQAGCTTSKHHSVYRRYNDVRLTDKKKRSTSKGVRKIDNQSMVYGKPSGETQPLGDLLSMGYQREWLVSQEKRLKERDQAVRQHKRERQAKTQLRHTKASVGHMKKKRPPQKKPFKLSQFRNVQSRVGFPSGNWTNDQKSLWGSNWEINASQTSSAGGRGWARPQSARPAGRQPLHHHHHHTQGASAHGAGYYEQPPHGAHTIDESDLKVDEYDPQYAPPPPRQVAPGIYAPGGGQQRQQAWGSNGGQVGSVVDHHPDPYNESETSSRAGTPHVVHAPVPNPPQDDRWGTSRTHGTIY